MNGTPYRRAVLFMLCRARCHAKHAKHVHAVHAVHAVAYGW